MSSPGTPSGDIYMKNRFLVTLALCTAFTSANAAGSYWIPYAAPSTTGGATELYVIPSDNLAAKPALVGKFTALLEGAAQLTVNKSNVLTAYAPYGMIYLAAGTNGKTHLYGVNLTEVSAPPKPEQLSSLALESTTELCGFQTNEPNLQTLPLASNAFDPATAFVLLHTNPKGAASCNKGGDVYEVVHYTDPATKAPTVVDITIESFDGFSSLPETAVPIYESNGQLGGVVLANAAGKLEFYAGAAFASHTVLTTGVTAVLPLYYAAPDAPPVPMDVTFLAVSRGTEQSLWRVSSAGKAEEVYTFQGALGGVTSDTKNIYFLDNVTVANAEHDEGKTTQHLYRESLTGGTPLHLYTAPAVLSGPDIIGQLGLTLVGSNGSSLLLESVQSPSPTTIESSVVALPVDVAGSPHSIAGPFVGVDDLTVMMCTQSFGEPTLQDILLNVVSSTIDEGKAKISYSSEAVTVGGEIIQEKLADSQFLGVVPEESLGPSFCPSNAGLIAQVRGITATDGSYGGGSIFAFNLHGDIVPPKPAVTELHTSTGGKFTLKDTDSVGGNATFSSSGFIMAGYVGAGSLPTPPGPAGLAIDFSNDLIAVFSVPDSKIDPLF
jgi:hypothetical protein